ncbi:MAG: hypothetical protein HYV94_01295, partial [Candidatus Rokubacteria bacterium]|nr:hypothetical protein [Candidatus Rokubacteria bacterium]
MSAAGLRRLRLAGWALAVALGALQAWASRHDMNPDGVSYLDLGDAFVRGDLAQAVSAYWPPLYAVILGAAVGLLRPSPAWEFPLVHAVNFLLYLGALASLEFLLANAAPRSPGWPAWAWRAWGSALFLVAALHMVTLRLVTPDLLVLALFLLAAGWLGRWADGRVGPREAVLFGAALGAGALAKTVALPLAALGLGLALAAAPDRRRAAPRVLLALAAFVVVTGPWIGAVSARAGRFTPGENARLNYLWLVNREYAPPMFAYPGARPAGWALEHPPLNYLWLVNREYAPPMFAYPGARPAGWALEHPPRRVLDAPAVWEFARPVGGTLPLWLDPGYWHAGAAMRFSVADHAAALRRSARAYGRLTLRLLPLAVGLAVLILLAGRPGWTRREVALAVFALVPLGGYALIHVEPRYVVGAVVVLGLALLAAVRAAEPRALAAVTLTALPLAVLPVAI